MIISYEGKKLPESYKAMIFSKWLRSLRYGNEYFRLTEKESYFRNYHKYIDRILQGATIRLCVLPDDNDVVLGFSVARGGILDYVHVHKDNRRLGIGTALLPKPNNVIIITHITKSGASFWHNRLPEAVFDPFI